MGLLPSTQFISLEAGPTAWAKAIVNSKRHNRQSRYEELKAAGYDIENETERVEKLLLDAYHKLA